jgi:hypothetical protein
MSSKVALMAEHSASIDIVVGAALQLPVVPFIVLAMFAHKKRRDDAAGVIDRGSIVRREDRTESM